EMSFAENFRAARKELKLTQEEVAKLIGVERSAVAHYENGTSLPHAGNLQKICEILEIPIEKLFK
ncbi:MAG TPA: transcriptional regulator, partial [Ruminococcaceae bacterium]|nr:transcriptional regulator [Oscillospiraceae bacterium]